MKSKAFNCKKLVVVLTSLLMTAGITACNSNASSNKNSSFSSVLGQGSSSNVSEQNWKYTYNNMNQIETVTDPNDNTTRYDYDSVGRLIKVTNPLKQTITFADFDKYGNPETIVDENGVTTKLTYTTRGWLHTATYGDAVTTFTYDEVGNLTKKVLPDNTTLIYTYDDANYLKSVANAGNVINYTRDDAGNVVLTYISGTSKGTTYTDSRVYDELNRLLRITTALTTINFSYDNSNNLSSRTDGRNHRTAFAYDELQRLTQITDAKNNPIKYTYDNSKNPDYPSSVTDSKGTKTLYEYNGLANLLKLASPDSGSHNYTAYDGNGNLLQQQDARGNSISYTYDELNRPKTITYADQSENTIFTYDNGSNSVGRLTKVQNGVSSNSYYYDEHGNTNMEVQKIDGVDYSITYGYDKADHLTNIVYPSKAQVAYIYTHGELTKVLVNGKSVAEITHLPYGPIDHVTYGNGVSENIDYNTDYSIKQFQLSNGLINREYTYYPNGQIKAITGIGSYDYDQLNSLTKADNDSYAYDKNQNRISQTVAGVKTDYGIENSSNRLESSSTTNYQYDAAGNVIQAGNKKYVYDNLNRLKTVTLDDTTLLDNQYNAFSQRILKTAEGNKFTYIYNSAGKLLEERNKNTGMIRDYIYADGKLIAAVENGIIVYIVTDHTNTPQIVMDSTGKQIWNAKYDAFGKTMVISNYKLNIRADGQYQDDETGLYYNWYRYYDPTLGRYITSDPMGLTAGMNTYVYVNGNPINYTDPMGLATCTYTISGHQLNCLSNDLSQSAQVGPNGVFSGGRVNAWYNPFRLFFVNNNQRTNVGNWGAIPEGAYDMHPNADHPDFWDLGDKCKPKSEGNKKRCSLMLHPGSNSMGCITIDKNNPEALSQYDAIKYMLRRDSHNKVFVIP